MYLLAPPAPGMRRLPWHLAMRVDRHAALAMAGVMVGVAFAVVSLSVPEGLRLETVNPDGPFGRHDALVARPGLVPFPPGLVGWDNVTVIQRADVDTSFGRAAFVALHGPAAPPVVSGEARAGDGGTRSGSFVAAGQALSWGAPIDSPFVARTWTVVAPETLEALAPEMGAHATYVLAHGLDAGREATLRDAGFDVTPVPGIEPFFRASTAEVATGLTLVVLFSGTLVALFAYEFLRSEVRRRRREIAVWRALGMDARDVLALLLARAVAIGSTGTALGVVLAAGVLAAAARATDADVFRGSPSALLWSLTIAVFILASAVGGFVPARAAARQTIRALELRA